MVLILPISTSRVTDVMKRDRLALQLQNDQLDLFRLQNQLTTGQRIFLPSDDASAAQRAISLQRTIERKNQSATNLQGAVSALSTADSALAEVSTQLSSLKSEGLGAINSFSSENDRQALRNTINGLLDQLTSIGNSRFTGSYIFGGTETSDPPYESPNAYVEYLGDESSPQTYVDIGFLFDTGTSGNDVFGGLSDEIRATEDLNPQPSGETRLAQLNGGSGVGENGSFQITFDTATPGDPNTTAVIDLSRADTLADVARLIEENAPDGADLRATVSGVGLSISASSGTISISEVADGTAAAELGLPTGAAAATIQGSDLDPVLRISTKLGDLVGVKSRGLLQLPGANNDLQITASQNGASFNNLTVTLVGGGTVGAETAVYNAGANELTITVASGGSTGNDIAAAINNEGTFSASTDYRDAGSFAQQGTGTASASLAGDSYAGVTDSQGADGEIDLASGLLITNGAETYTIDTSAAETVEDLLSVLNRPEYGVVAAINADGNGIDIRSRRSGADFAIAENGGTTATDLGVLTYRGDSLLADFNHGVGVVVEVEGSENDPGVAAGLNSFRITVSDAGVTETYDVDVTQATTVDELIDAINNATPADFTASLQTTGNGLVLNGAYLNVPAATPADGSIDLTFDTIDFDAVTPGAAGNQDFTLEVVDSGAGGLSTTVDGNNITVDLGGSTTETSATIAASIDTQVADFTVSSVGAVAVPPGYSLAVSDFSTTGGLDASAAGADSITVSGSVAERLGFLAEGQDSVTSTTGSLETIEDRNTLQVDSVFTTLIRMREAIDNNDIEALGLEINNLDDDITRVNFARAEIGTRLQGLESIEFRLADENVQLQSALSNNLDADLVEVISEFTARQASLQASLQVSSILLNQTILDYI